MFIIFKVQILHEYILYSTNESLFLYILDIHILSKLFIQKVFIVRMTGE